MRTDDLKQNLVSIFGNTKTHSPAGEYQDHDKQSPVALKRQETRLNRPGPYAQNSSSSSSPSSNVNNLFRLGVNKVMLANNFVQSAKKKSLESHQILRQSIKDGLTNIQKNCNESNDNISSKLKKLRKSLDRETLIKENVQFTA